MVDATYAVDQPGEVWCHACDVDAAECDCQWDHRGRASLGACAVQRYTAADVMSAPCGHDGETSVSDANRTRYASPVYLSRDEWQSFDLGRDDAQGRKLRGVIVDNVTMLIGPCGSGAALGHSPLPRKPRRVRTGTRANRKAVTAARKRSARAGAELTARREALAAELVEMMGALSIGGARPIPGHDAKVKRTRRDRWTIGAMSGAKPEALAERAAKALVS